MNFRQFQALVKAATGVKHTYRIRSFNTLTTAGLQYYNLMTTDDDPDYDVATPGLAGTTPLETETNSRIVGIDLNIVIRFLAAGRYAEWMLWKDPDGVLGATITPSQLFTNDVDTTTALLRKYCLAYGFMLASTSNENKAAHVRISRAALKRAGTMKDGDILRLSIATSAGTDNINYMRGRIWTRK